MRTISPIADYELDTDPVSSPIIEGLVDKGPHDELTGEAHAVIGGTEGRAHHGRSRRIETFADAPPIQPDLSPRGEV